MLNLILKLKWCKIFHSIFRNVIATFLSREKKELFLNKGVNIIKILKFIPFHENFFSITFLLVTNYCIRLFNYHINPHLLKVVIKNVHPKNASTCGEVDLDIKFFLILCANMLLLSFVSNLIRFLIRTSDKLINRYCLKS